MNFYGFIGFAKLLNSPQRREYIELDLYVCRDFVEIMPIMIEDEILFNLHLTGVKISQ